MNPLLSHLQPYPFERLRQLFAGMAPPAAYSPISLGMGEPRHPTPQFIKDVLCSNLGGLASYPATAGEPRLREAFAGWIHRRYAVSVDPGTQVLPVNGSREALFAFAQTIIDPSADQPLVVCPNPFYQIYEGAALLSGAAPYYAPSDPSRNFAVNWDTVPEAVWQRTQLLFVCSPGNPTAAAIDISGPSPTPPRCGIRWTRWPGCSPCGPAGDVKRAGTRARRACSSTSTGARGPVWGRWVPMNTGPSSTRWWTS